MVKDDHGEPKRKTLKFTERSVLSVAAVNQLKEMMLCAPVDSEEPGFRDFDMKGKLCLLTASFFDADVPIIGDSVCLPC